MKLADAFPSPFLRQSDVPRPQVEKISRVKIEQIRSKNGVKQRPVLYFWNKKPLILNKTNWLVLEKAYGDSDGWSGKSVEIYVDPDVCFGGDRIGGVRLRIPPTSGEGRGARGEEKTKQALEPSVQVEPKAAPPLTTQEAQVVLVRELLAKRGKSEIAAVHFANPDRTELAQLTPAELQRLLETLQQKRGA